MYVLLTTMSLPATAASPAAATSLDLTPTRHNVTPSLASVFANKMLREDSAESKYESFVIKQI